MTGAKCQSCGQPLLWVENVKTGKRLPLVDKPIRGDLSQDQVKPGMVIVSPSKRKAQVLTLEVIGEWSEGLQEAIEGGRLHQTHFADCSRSKDWASGRLTRGTL